MPTEPRFTKSASDSRPFGSHRFDVYGPKVGRTLTLFGQTSLRTWTLLEADPAISLYCERPLMIADAKPQRVVDFWIRSNNGEQFWLLLRKGELDGASYLAPSSAFGKWCDKNHIAPRFLEPPETEEAQLFFDNWGAILRYLACNRKASSIALSNQILALTNSAKSLAMIEDGFPEVDRTEIRSSLFNLVHKGVVSCLDIRDKALCEKSTFVAT